MSHSHSSKQTPVPNKTNQRGFLKEWFWFKLRVGTTGRDTVNCNLGQRNGVSS